MITQTRLLELFIYEDGALYWEKSLNNRAPIGTVAGTNLHKGYKVVGIDGTNYLLHRLIYLYHHGLLPTSIDHIDGNTTNNSIDNLRKATLSQNQCNKKIGINNTSGIKGVTWNKRVRMWQAGVGMYGKFKFLGYFWDAYTADLTVKRERKLLHKEFANDG